MQEASMATGKRGLAHISEVIREVFDQLQLTERLSMPPITIPKTIILAIDPGPEQSAVVLYDPVKRVVMSHGKHGNYEIRDDLWMYSNWYSDLVIEMVASYGKPVGAETFETCVWIGRFIEASPDPDSVIRIERKDVKMHLCQATAKVTDAVIRQRLIDLFGPGKDKAIGKKACPGPLYGIKADCWQALALAVTYADKLAGAAP
jgi:hypothetical protein